MSHRGSQWLVFACVAIAQFMVILDVTVINVALPTIKVQLHFGNAAIGWVVTAYVLAFGGFLLFGGRAADLFGRRRMLLTGMAAFTACSFLAGISPDPALLIVLRGAQGLSAALMLLGGVVIARVMPTYGPGETRATLDVPGAALVTAGLMAAVFYFTQAPAWGWLGARTLPALAGALVLLGLFVVHEQRAEQPLVPLAIFRNRSVSGANAAMAAVYGGNLGMFFLITLYLQLVEHSSAVGTGLAILLVPVVMGPVAAQMRRLIARHGPRRYLILGPALVAAGMAWACFLPVHGNYLLPALLVMPVGYGMSYPSAYAAATAGVPARQAGLASGLISTAQQMGGAIGLAVISAVAASYTASATGESGRQALTSGYNLAMAVAAGLTLLASVIAATVIRSAARRRQEHQPRESNVRRQSYASSAGGSA